jgi:sugar lactone lactonase YvrE
MNMNKENKRFTLRLFSLAAAALLCLSTWAAADGPVADFPSFIQFDIIKTGDVAVDKIGNVYVNVTENDGHVRIWKFSPEGEGPFVVGDIGIGTAYGLAVDAEGNVYANNGGTADNGYQDRGIYRVGRDGIPVRLLGTEQIVWPNALAFDQRGNLYVTESFSVFADAFGQGGIWRIPPGEPAELWLRDDLLTGKGNVVSPLPVGANGIAFYHNDLYVVNTDKSLIVRIPVHPDGSPGQPDIWAELQEVPESPLAGMLIPAGDGLALDVHGNAYVPVVSRVAVVRINAEDMSQETIATYSFNPNEPLLAPLDTPNSLAFGTGKGGRKDLFITNVGSMAILVPGAPWPGPGLLKIEAGVPGLPLP